MAGRSNTKTKEERERTHTTHNRAPMANCPRAPSCSIMPIPRRKQRISSLATVGSAAKAWACSSALPAEEKAPSPCKPLSIGA